MHKKILSIAKTLNPARLPELVIYLLRDEAISGKFILGATVLALIAVNTVAAPLYGSLWGTTVHLGVGEWAISKDLRHWVNEALMAIFFLVVGLELKRELVQGELRHKRTAALPFAAALGGMIVPAILYISFNAGSDAISGWAIPMATDIAFAIGILALIGKAVPASIRLFLLTLAIVDDIGAVIVIATFYSSGISFMMLGLAAAISVAMISLSRARILTMPAYIIGSIALWLVIDNSGVHASIAGVLMGLLAPLSVSKDRAQPLAERVERAMIPVSTFIVVPLFAFANTGVSFSIGDISSATAIPLVAGVIMGLVIGKVTGIVFATWLMVRSGYADLPSGATWLHVIGIGLLAGIGFTVSIFVTELAFDREPYVNVSKLSIFLASALSALFGIAVLLYARRAGKRSVTKVASDYSQ